MSAYLLPTKNTDIKTFGTDIEAKFDRQYRQLWEHRMGSSYGEPELELQSGNCPISKVCGAGYGLAGIAMDCEALRGIGKQCNGRP